MRARAQRGFIYRVATPMRLFFSGFNWIFERLSRATARSRGGSYAWALIMLVVYGALIYVAYDRLTRTPTGLIPQLDRGYLITAFQLPPGASLARTDAVIRQATEIIMHRPGVQSAVAFAGFDGATFTNAPNAGVIFASLKPFEERVPHGLTRPSCSPISGARWLRLGTPSCLCSNHRPCPASAPAAALRAMLRIGRDGASGRWKEPPGRCGHAPRRHPDSARSSRCSTPTRRRSMPTSTGPKPSSCRCRSARVFEALSVFMGSSYVNDFNLLGRTYQVTAQADNPFRLTLRDVENLKTRNNDGDMVPIGSVATFGTRPGRFVCRATISIRLPNFSST